MAGAHYIPPYSHLDIIISSLRNSVATVLTLQRERVFSFTREQKSNRIKIPRGGEMKQRLD